MLSDEDARLVVAAAVAVVAVGSGRVFPWTVGIVVVFVVVVVALALLSGVVILLDNIGSYTTATGTKVSSSSLLSIRTGDISKDRSC